MLAAVTACATAQNYGFDIYLRGGAGFPDAPELYANNWKSGPHIGTGFEFTLSQRISVGAGLEYARNPLKKNHLIDGTVLADTRLSGGVLDMFSFAVFLNYRMLGRVVSTFPYITMDAGATHTRINDQTVSSSDRNNIVTGSSETAFRAAWGLGLDVPLSSTVAFSVGAKYILVFAEEERRGYVPVDAGFKFVF